METKLEDGLGRATSQETKQVSTKQLRRRIEWLQINQQLLDIEIRGFKLDESRYRRRLRQLLETLFKTQNPATAKLLCKLGVKELGFMLAALKQQHQRIMLNLEKQRDDLFSAPVTVVPSEACDHLIEKIYKLDSDYKKSVLDVQKLAQTIDSPPASAYLFFLKLQEEPSLTLSDAFNQFYFAKQTGAFRRGLPEPYQSSLWMIDLFSLFASLTINFFGYKTTSQQLLEYERIINNLDKSFQTFSHHPNQANYDQMQLILDRRYVLEDNAILRCKEDVFTQFTHDIIMFYEPESDELGAYKTNEL